MECLFVETMIAASIRESNIKQHICYLCVAARPLLYRGTSSVRTPGVDHFPAWHKMSCWWWQRTHSQTEKMWRCFKDLPETLGLYTGKRKYMFFLITHATTSNTPNIIKYFILKGNVQRLSYFHAFLLQNGPIISRDTGRCLEVEMSKDANFGLRLVVQRCSGQKWMIRNWIKHPRHWSQRTTSETVWAVFQVAVGSQMLNSSGRSGDCCCKCVVFHTTDCSTHWAPSGHGALQHWVLKKNMINSRVLLSCAFTETLRQAALFEMAHISDIELHV